MPCNEQRTGAAVVSWSFLKNDFNYGRALRHWSMLGTF